MKKTYHIPHTTYRIPVLGFTLVEILVVMAIMAILLTIGVANYLQALKKARDGRRKADLESVRSALEMARSDCGTYPLGVLISGDAVRCVATATTYITIPDDPLSSSYRYIYNGTANVYTLCAYLETGALTSTCTSACGGDCGNENCNYTTCNP